MAHVTADDSEYVWATGGELNGTKNTFSSF